MVFFLPHIRRDGTAHRMQHFSMKAALVLNPVAGRPRTAGLEDRIRREMRKYGIECEIMPTSRSGEAVELARRAADDGCELVIAGGGDGTVNEVINGIAGTNAKFAVLPLGTVNVLARELGIPLNSHKAIRVIADGAARQIDLGHANGRYFALMAGLGFDAEVVANVVRPLKDMIGAPAYILNGLKTIASYDATALTLEMPDETYSAEAFLIIIANISRYTYNLKIAPYASPNDGLLDICIFERPSTDRIGFMRQVADTFVNRHVYHRSVKYFRVPWAKVTSHPNVFVQLDGDAFCTTPIQVSAVPSALSVITPHG
jgi:diacylglycerol kinase (ATP)